MIGSGTVTWVDAKRGYGFITADRGGTELFVQRSDVKGAFDRLVLGARVDFESRVGAKGRILAGQIQLTGADRQPKPEPLPEAEDDPAEEAAENEGMPPKPE